MSSAVTEVLARCSARSVLVVILGKAEHYRQRFKVIHFIGKRTHFFGTFTPMSCVVQMWIPQQAKPAKKDVCSG
jgi:hypothetical protein